MLSSLKNYLQRRKMYRLRKLLRPGETVSRFVARDVKREVLVVSAEEIDAGFITAQIRTINVLYRSKGLVEKQGFGPPERIEVDKLWDWTGQSWGGLADGTSIVDHIES